MGGLRMFFIMPVSMRPSWISRRLYARTWPSWTGSWAWREMVPLWVTLKPRGCWSWAAISRRWTPLVTRIMKIDPYRIDYLKRAEFVLGTIDEADIVQVGDRMPQFTEFTILDYIPSQKRLQPGYMGEIRITLTAPDKQKGRGFLSQSPKLPYLLKIGQYTIITVFSLCCSVLVLPNFL